MGIKETLSKANTIVTNKEARDLTVLAQQAMIAEARDDSTTKFLSDQVKEEVARLQPCNTHDHEEVFAGANIYTSGRKGFKPKLTAIKGEIWIKTGK